MVIWWNAARRWRLVEQYIGNNTDRSAVTSY